MGLFNRKARFIERRKQQLALEPGERDRRKTPHIYPQVVQQRVHTHNTYVDNTTVVVDNSPDLVTQVIEAEIIADAMQPSQDCTPQDNCCAPSQDFSTSSDSPCYDSTPDTSSDPFGGGGDSGGGGADSSW